MSNFQSLDAEFVSEVEGHWPAQCMTCQRMLTMAGFSEASWKNTIEGLRERVAKHLKTHTELSENKVCHRKRHVSQPENAAPAKQIKQELKVKQEPLEIDEDNQKPAIKKEQQPGEANAEDVPEVSMGKAALVQLHKLEVLPKKTQKKLNPVYCPWCSTTFEGRNAAKILQHVKGHQHRSRWKQGISGVKSELAVTLRSCKRAADQSDQDSVQLGKCCGLRLGSSIGAKTRLGSDLRPVWDIYTKYAFLERTLMMPKMSKVVFFSKVILNLR